MNTAMKKEQQIRLAGLTGTLANPTSLHRQLSRAGVPRTKDGNRLGLRKRMRIAIGLERRPWRA